MESTLKNMVLVLLTITLVASAAVGVVYTLTKEPIKIAKEQKLNSAIVQVLPQFTDLMEPQTVDVEGEGVNVYRAKNGEEEVGLAVESFSKNGFGGVIKVLVGFTPDGTIFSSEVISHSETPGLGDKMDKNKSDFALQFKGKNPATNNLTVKKDGGEVDAITAATISSRAYTDAIKNAYKAFELSKGNS